jgi:hypothetical protein
VGLGVGPPVGASTGIIVGLSVGPLVGSGVKRSSTGAGVGGLEGEGVVPGGVVSRPRSRVGLFVGDSHTHSHVGGLVSRRNTGEEVGLTVLTGAKVSLAGGTVGLLTGAKVSLCGGDGE